MADSLSLQAASLLNALRKHSENDSVQEGWRDVYLDNATTGIPERSIPGLLSALTKAGYYKPIDGYAFGSVKMT